ncbi:MAG: hypothetical protein GF317_07605 [Candidatus Lokiarchaeota archaeon]|nr:hypothetical protein [Candidatus Lokiarchaeota archaeon]MBD3199577.1 hypothetical protein [Candidatus Lokiarchaeota archaeon]
MVIGIKGQSLREIRAKLGPLDRVKEIQCWDTRYIIEEVKNDILYKNQVRLDSIYNDVRLCFTRTHMVTGDTDKLYVRGMEPATVKVLGFGGREKSFNTDAFTAWSLFLSECAKLE